MPVNKAKLKILKDNMKRTFKDISDKKAPQFVSAVLSIGENHSKELAPVAYSFLINNIIKDLNVSGSKVTGTLTYAQNYAAALEFRTDWKPKPPPKYGNKKKGIAPAPAWNPNATPHYLKRGFEDQESQALIKRVEGIFKI